MKIMEAERDGALTELLIGMSARWEAEKCTYGYGKNGPSDIQGKRIFLAVEGERVLGYLFGVVNRMESFTCIMDADTPYFEIEELYVCPEYRNRGIGKALMSHAEQVMKGEGIPYLLLATATKNYKAILHFYIEEVGMEFWTAQLFKKL